jgi:hypothetical protein
MKKKILLSENQYKLLLENDNSIEVKQLQKELNRLENVELEKARVSKDYTLWDKIVNEMNVIRRKLYELTNDSYGRTEKEKNKINDTPKGLNSEYSNPTLVPKSVYKWIFKHTSLLNTDATDAVRWSRIINTKNEVRYPSGEMTIYRAVDNQDYDDIREGDWVTTDEKYALKHNNMYFDGNGKIISMDVDGRDVLISPTGDYEEAIYAPLKYSIDVKL